MPQTLSLEGQEYVVIPRKEYEYLVSQYKDDETFPAEFVHAVTESEQRITLWRKYRGLSMSELAARVGISQSYLSDIESGKKAGSIRILKLIARELNADLELIV